MPEYQVWYKKEWVQDTAEALADFSNCYVPVMRIWEENLEDVYMVMQGEFWSPQGEARSANWLPHTSMSVGDVVENLDDGDWSECLAFGFRDITDYMKGRV